MVERGGLERSLLFVPGSEPRRFARARAAGADVVLFDLEDAVAEEEKARAREHVVEALRAGGFADTEPAVRVNGAATPHFATDLEAVIAAGARTIMVPKCERAGEVARVAEVVATIERRLGIAPDAGVRVLALVETALGVASAVAVAGATARIRGLCFGHADFARDMGLDDADTASGVVLHARCTLAIAARAGGVAPIDTVCLAVHDEAAFRADAALGARLGFEGKLCIHPRQVEIANEVHTPAPERIERARRVMAGWREAQASGRGVFTLDGRMVDAPVVAVEARVLERARRAGALGDA